MIEAKKFGTTLTGVAEQSEKPWTNEAWIYDLRTNVHFASKTNPLKRADFEDFVEAFQPVIMAQAGKIDLPAV